MDVLQKSLTLHLLADKCEPTATHRFLAELRAMGKLLRVYTQNFDALEEKAGLRSGLAASDDCIRLHGSAHHLRCDLCGFYGSWQGFEEAFAANSDLECPRCRDICFQRVAAGKRAVTVARLRPAIVHSGEEHPEGAHLQQLIDSDAVDADFLLILGTSLSTHGPRRLVRKFARNVHAKNGTVACVNRAGSIGSWCTAIVDVSVTLTCDDWASDCRKRLQRELVKRRRKPGSSLQYPIVID